MNEEYEGYADLNGVPYPVTCYYELDGYKPLGLYICREPDGMDITESLSADEYDRLYNEVCADVVSDMADAADMMEDRRDHEREDKAYWAELEATK